MDNEDIGEFGDTEDIDALFGYSQRMNWEFGNFADEFDIRSQALNLSGEKSRSREKEKFQNSNRPNSGDSMKIEYPRKPDLDNLLNLHYNHLESTYPDYLLPLDSMGSADTHEPSTEGIADIPRTADSSTQPKQRKRSAHLGRDRSCCNCEKTKCLKMYCACYRKGLPCSERCRCRSCYNTVQNQKAILISKESQRVQAEKEKLERQEHAHDHAHHEHEHHSHDHQHGERGFEYENMDENVNAGNGAPLQKPVEEIFCSCRMSFCEKSYCACARAQKKCSPKCKCFHCKNSFGPRPLPPPFHPPLIKCY